MKDQIYIYIYIYGDQLFMKYCWGCMDWAYGPMAQFEDANRSKDGQLR